MSRFSGWWRLWVFVSLAWSGGALILFWPEPIQSGPLRVHTGRVGDVKPIEDYTAQAFGGKCLHFGRSVKTEKRVGIPNNAEEESETAGGIDDPDFPNVEKAPKGAVPDNSIKPETDEPQPYLITRVYCPDPSAILNLLRWAFIPPFMLLFLGLGTWWTIRGFRTRP